MTNLLFLNDNLQTFIYVVGNETLLDIALKVGVPPTLIIYDNNLNKAISEGMCLVIKRRSELKMLTKEELDSISDIEYLKKINKCDHIYPYQPIILSEEN